jgi:hypothetical protein
MVMDDIKGMVIETPMGKQKVDSDGPLVGVTRMDTEKSYAGIGDLLQRYINDSNQKAWEAIKTKIDYTYRNLDLALDPLKKETNLVQEINQRLEKGQKLLFKPNIVTVANIDPQTHGQSIMASANTEWGFIAALMKWFHDDWASVIIRWPSGRRQPPCLVWLKCIRTLIPRGRR